MSEDKSKEIVQSKEIVDDALRKLGYDTEKLGYTGEVFTKVIFKNIELQQKVKRLEKALDRIGSATKSLYSSTDSMIVDFITIAQKALKEENK